MKNKKSFREMLLSGILDALRQLRRSPHQHSGALRSDQVPEEELKPAGDAHAGGPYASFYPEDDLGGFPNLHRWRDDWQDQPDDGPDSVPEPRILPALLAWMVLKDE